MGASILNSHVNITFIFSNIDFAGSLGTNSYNIEDFQGPPRAPGTRGPLVPGENEVDVLVLNEKVKGVVCEKFVVEEVNCFSVVRENIVDVLLQNVVGVGKESVVEDVNGLNVGGVGDRLLSKGGEFSRIGVAEVVEEGNSFASDNENSLVSVNSSLVRSLDGGVGEEGDGWRGEEVSLGDGCVRGVKKVLLLKRCVLRRMVDFW